MKTKRKTSKPVLAWGGFSDGRLHFMHVDTGFGGWGEGYDRLPPIFRNRKDARRQYRDVRRIRITEVKP